MPRRVSILYRLSACVAEVIMLIFVPMPMYIYECCVFWDAPLFTRYSLSCSSSWDEHLFELVLPRPCCVSHIDLKFSLHPLCITPPSIQITLLKQSSSTIGHATFPEPVGQMAAPPVEVDTGIDFKVDPQRVANYTLTREFLERHSAEVVCGPVELANFVDLSGRGGLVTLTSPKLLRIKTKSFLLHVKALPCERPPSPLQREKVAKTVSYGALMY